MTTILDYLSGNVTGTDAVSLACTVILLELAWPVLEPYFPLRHRKDRK